jgi:hypothetical protein
VTVILPFLRGYYPYLFLSVKFRSFKPGVPSAFQGSLLYYSTFLLRCSATKILIILVTLMLKLLAEVVGLKKKIATGCI